MTYLYNRNHVLYISLFSLDYCKPGYYSESGLNDPQQACKSCPKGSYSYENGTKACMSCPDKSTTLKEGTADPNECYGKLVYHLRRIWIMSTIRRIGIMSMALQLIGYFDTNKPTNCRIVVPLFFPADIYQC